MKRKRPDVLQRHVVALYAAGYNCDEIGKTVGLTKSGVAFRLRKAGAKLRSRGWRYERAQADG